MRIADSSYGESFAARCPRPAATLAAVLLLLGCSSAHYVRVLPDEVPVLAEDEAIIVAQIDTELPIERLIWTGLVLRQPTAVGRSLWIARIPAGRYSWNSVVIGGERPYGGRYFVRKRRFQRPQELDLDVRAGRVNYVGELRIDKGTARLYGGSTIWVAVQNHVASALRQMEREYPALLNGFVLHDALTNRDEFLEFYSEARGRARARLAAGPD